MHTHSDSGITGTVTDLFFISYFIFMTHTCTHARGRDQVEVPYAAGYNGFGTPAGYKYI